jgi:predicted acyltransferase
LTAADLGFTMTILVFPMATFIAGAVSIFSIALANLYMVFYPFTELQSSAM